jgi:putative redox protein
MKEKESNESFPVEVSWVQKSQFIARDERNHAIVVDVSPEGGGDGTGPSPTRLMLMAVAACTSIDVVDILQKSRQELTGLKVYSRGVQNSEYPKYFKEIYLKYVLRGINLDKTRVERAIELSEEKYCSVGATLSGKAKIFTSYEIENEHGNPVSS